MVVEIQKGNKMNDKMNDLERDKAILGRRNAELETVAEAVMTLINFAVKGEDLRDLRSDPEGLRSDIEQLRSDIQELRSDDARIDETSSTLDGVVRALRDAAAELASV